MHQDTKSATIWNNLPADIRNMDNLSNFKLIKRIFLLWLLVYSNLSPIICFINIHFIFLTSYIYIFLTYLCIIIFLTLFNVMRIEHYMNMRKIKIKIKIKINTNYYYYYLNNVGSTSNDEVFLCYH